MILIFVIISEYIPSDTCVPVKEYRNNPPMCEGNMFYRVQLRNASLFACFDKSYCGTFKAPDQLFRNCNTPDDIVDL